jgi:restriction endonuclease S subunit
MEYLRGLKSSEKKCPKENSVYAEQGDILLLWDGSKAGEFIEAKSGLLGSTLAKLENKGILLNGYLKYTTTAFEKVLQDLTIGMGIPHVSGGVLKNLHTPVPPKKEQKQIADYLDEKTGKIDVLVAKNEKLIELLKEKRQALITKAVTKGLDPNANMIDSGIDWIGKIPEGWNMKPLKYLVDLKGEKAECKTSPYVGMADVLSWEGKLITEFEEGVSNKGKLFAKNDVLFGKLRPYLAKVWQADFSGIASGEFLVMRTRDQLLPRFLKYRLLSVDFISVVDNATYGVRMPRAEWSFVGGLKIGLPSKKEQKQIVDYLDKKTSTIDKLVEKLEKQNEKLKEYRQALIYNLVTGKVRVV